MDIQLTLQQENGIRPLTFRVSRMVNAGYTGRDQDEVRKHIDELAEKGIPGPEKTPTLYPVVPKTLTKDSRIDVYGAETCGEIEYVLFVVDDNEIYVGIGSDHTDRHLEETDIPRSKQICPNLVSETVWPLAEVEAHWDRMIMKSDVICHGETIAYQDGPLERIMGPRALLDFVRTRVPGSLAGTVIYSGTLGSLTGGFVFGERFSSRLTDPVLKRSLVCDYAVQTLDYMTAE